MRRISAASALLVAGFGGLAATLAWRSLPWPLVHDAPILHYVAWRLAQGAVPYRDLFDMNQPGAYLLHLAAVQTLGAGDLAWRMLDLAWLGATAALIAAFAAPWGVTAAAGSAFVFAAYHLAGGAWQAGQRDFLLCLFLVVGALGVARWLEQRRLASLLWAGAALGAGITVKPHAVLFAALLAVLVAVVAARSAGAWGAVTPTLTLAAAVAVAPCAMLAWLGVTGAFAAWREIVVDYLVPLYARLGRDARWSVYRWQVWIPLGAGVAVSLVSVGIRRAAGWRHVVAALGVAYGVVHYLGQGKGWEYHLYPLAAFAALLFCCEVRGVIATRRVAVGVPLVASLAAGLVLLGAKGLEASGAEPWWDRERMVRAVVAEVRPLLRTGDTVQVLDTTEGGIHALLRLGVAEPTRFLYDFHFFHDVDTPVVRALRAEFVRDLAARPPRAIVVFERGWPSGGYERVAAFPALAERLERNYTLARDRDGFRVYAKRRDS